MRAYSVALVGVGRTVERRKGRTLVAEVMELEVRRVSKASFASFFLFLSLSHVSRPQTTRSPNALLGRRHHSLARSR